MITSKLLKDPIYGYVNIESYLVTNIIDTSCFQRLRNIRQTSYAPLYSASMHNRFIHSIGVYHLGEIAFKAFKESVIEKFPNIIAIKQWSMLKKYFLLACLLHDVGHAPFSHSGEDFFLNEKGQGDKGIAIYEMLLKFVNVDTFTKDVIDFYHIGKEVAAPHEIMSVVVSIRNFKKYFNNHKYRDFFARCITGYKYRDLHNDDELSVKNCLISLLNSTVIDVDRLDYIIRDSFMTGFQSVSIDYCRLLNSLTMVEMRGQKVLAFNKSALSVIENIVYAHDSERKWIQNHPVVIYENFLIQHAIRKVDKYFNKENKKNKLFSYQSLSDAGNDFKQGGKIRLLSDEDIIFNIKNVCEDELTKEYFCRASRRHPIWKSEAEYVTLFDKKLGDDSLDQLELTFLEIEKFLVDNFAKPVINHETIKQCEDEYKRLEEIGDQISTKDKESRKRGLDNIMKWFNILLKFSDENGILFDYVVISAKKFQSGFIKLNIDQVLIDFPEYGKSKYIKDIINTLNAVRTREHFFFLFYKRTDKKIDANAFASNICMELMSLI